MKTTHVLFSVAGVTIVSSSLFSCQQKQEQKKGYYCTAVPYAFLFILYSNPKHLICFFLPVKLFSV